MFVVQTAAVGRAAAEAVDLSVCGTANCYIIPAAGEYGFSVTRGASSGAIDGVASVSLLWSCPEGIVKDLSFAEGRISFTSPEPFIKGNALVGALDKHGKVLWSWHLWLTEQPGERVCSGDAGVALDRNLGAVSTGYLQEGSDGLKYQWGRKDPFAPGMYDTVVSDPRTGTEKYALEHPCTFICGNPVNRDWLYPGNEIGAQQYAKGLNDPCPVGWQLPRGDFWLSSAECSVYGSELTGLIMVAGPREDLPGISPESEGTSGWYPAAGYLDWRDGTLAGRGVYGFYMSCTAVGELSAQMYFFRTGYNSLQRSTFRSYGQSVRCVKQ